MHSASYVGSSERGSGAVETGVRGGSGRLGCPRGRRLLVVLAGAGPSPWVEPTPERPLLHCGRSRHPVGRVRQPPCALAARGRLREASAAVRTLLLPSRDLWCVSDQHPHRRPPREEPHLRAHRAVAAASSTRRLAPAPVPQRRVPHVRDRQDQRSEERRPRQRLDRRPDLRGWRRRRHRAREDASAGGVRPVSAVLPGDRDQPTALPVDAVARIARRLPRRGRPDRGPRTPDGHLMRLPGQGAHGGSGESSQDSITAKSPMSTPRSET